MSLEIVVPFLAGSIGVPITNWLKKRFYLSGARALWVSVGISGILGVAGIALVGELVFTPAGIFATLGETFTIATLIYKSIERITFKK